MDWVYLAEDKHLWRCVVNTPMNLLILYNKARSRATASGLINHALCHEGMRGSGGMAPLQMSGQLHSPAALPHPRKSPGYESDWAPEPVWTLRKLNSRVGNATCFVAALRACSLPVCPCSKHFELNGVVSSTKYGVP
jgi:hypothetical protein